MGYRLGITGPMSRPKEKGAICAAEDPRGGCAQGEISGHFLNDEAPALTNWVKQNHGNYNHEFYSKVFDLLLRLKANYLWPAMWANAFNDDDPKPSVGG